MKNIDNTINDFTDDQMNKIIDGLNIFRSDDMNCWIVAGYIFKELYGLNYSFFERFSKKSTRYDSAVKSWYLSLNVTDKKDKATIGTILYWLKLDNPEKYDEIMTEKVLGNYKIYDFNTEYKVDFSIETMNNIFKQDTQILGDKYCKYFEYTNSFKYFNHYHGYFYLSNTVYKIFDSNLKAYSNFRGAFNHLYITTKDTRILFTSLYDKSSKKHVYSDFDFNPENTEISDIYNLFKGFIFDDKNYDFDEKKIELYINHVKFMCRNEEKAYNYVLNWMAHIIQKPNVKTNVCLLFYSFLEGVGKNIMIDCFEKLLTGYVIRFKNSDAITDKFNGDMMGKLLCVGDEINARAQEIAGELRDTITRKKEIIEFKGKDKIIVNDYKNYVLTTNQDNILRVPLKDRHYALIEAPEEVKSPEYYKNLLSFIEDQEKMKMLYNYFKTRDIKDFVTRDIPMTEYKKGIIMANLPLYLRFIKDRYNTLSEIDFSVKELYDECIKFAIEKKIPQVTEMTFSKQIKLTFNNYQKLINKRSYYYFPKNKYDSIIEIISNMI